MRKCISNFTDVMINILNKNNLERNRLIWLMLPGHRPSLMEVKARTEGRLACYLYTTLSLTRELPANKPLVDTVYWLSC